MSKAKIAWQAPLLVQNSDACYICGHWPLNNENERTEKTPKLKKVISLPPTEMAEIKISLIKFLFSLPKKLCAQIKESGKANF